MFFLSVATTISVNEGAPQKYTKTISASQTYKVNIPNSHKCAFVLFAADNIIIKYQQNSDFSGTSNSWVPTETRGLGIIFTESGEITIEPYLAGTGSYTFFIVDLVIHSNICQKFGVCTKEGPCNWKIADTNEVQCYLRPVDQNFNNMMRQTIGGSSNIYSTIPGLEQISTTSISVTFNGAQLFAMDPYLSPLTVSSLTYDFESIYLGEKPLYQLDLQDIDISESGLINIKPKPSDLHPFPTTAIIVCVVFVFIIMVFIVACTICYYRRKKKAKKQIEAASGSGNSNVNYRNSQNLASNPMAGAIPPPPMYQQQPQMVSPEMNPYYNIPPPPAEYLQPTYGVAYPPPPSYPQVVPYNQQQPQMMVQAPMVPQPYPQAYPIPGNSHYQ